MLFKYVFSRHTVIQLPSIISYFLLVFNFHLQNKFINNKNKNKIRKESAHKHLASIDIKVLSITFKIRKLSSSKLLIHCIAILSSLPKRILAK